MVSTFSEPNAANHALVLLHVSAPGYSNFCRSLEERLLFVSATGLAEGLVDLEFTGQLHPHFEGVNGIGLFMRNCAATRGTAEDWAWWSQDISSQLGIGLRMIVGGDE